MDAWNQIGTLPNSLLGLPVRESIYATRIEPVKLHKKRRNQSAAYHKRIQKKWTKRYGTKHVPCAYVIEDNVSFCSSGRTLIVHPQMMAKVRAMVQR